VVATPRPRRPRGTSPKRLGIFGGTFDPIHIGHLVLADQLREALKLDAVIMVPCNRSPHKPGYTPAPARHRLRMARLALRGLSGLEVSELETRRRGPSYTVDTVRRIRQRYGTGPDLWLLVGLDAYLEMETWREPEVILRECRLGVACRPGYRAARPRPKAGARVRFVEITQLDISSTALRHRLRSGRSITFLVPPAVEAYIRRHGLYGCRPGASRRRGGG
jgi:nicotinate-nucleotide adenylyltransferase